MIIILTNYLNLVTIYHVSGDSVQKFAIDATDATVASDAIDARHATIARQAINARQAIDASVASIAKTNAFAIVADARSSPRNLAIKT